MKVYSEDRGFVGVNKKQIFANTKNSTIYKISSLNSSTFYLFEGNTKKFLCWKKSLDNMVALDYRKINKMKHWHYCRFRDVPSTKKTRQDTHVHLHLEDHPEVRMRFDPKGRYISRQRLKRCIEKKRKAGKSLLRHANCQGNDNFMVWGDGDQKDCSNEAFEVFCSCKSQLRTMPELSKSCQEMGAPAKCY